MIGEGQNLLGQMGNKIKLKQISKYEYMKHIWTAGERLIERKTLAVIYVS